jgi:DNA-binding transcriptional regulator YiaG
MTNVATVLKAEISRVARKEIRAETTSLKKAVSGYRSEIAELKRRSLALEQQVKRLSKNSTKAVPETAAEEGSSQGLRFSAKGLASQRKRLGLSAEQCGLLIGASGQSVYNWESGETRPRASHLPAIALLRGMGKKEAAARLSEMKEAA